MSYQTFSKGKSLKVPSKSEIAGVWGHYKTLTAAANLLHL
jgi:hypothetical protein